MVCLLGDAICVMVRKSEKHYKKLNECIDIEYIFYVSTTIQF